MRFTKLFLTVICLLAYNTVFCQNSTKKTYNNFIELQKAVTFCIETQDEAFEKSVSIIDLSLQRLKAPDKQQAFLLRAYCFNQYLLNERYFYDPSVRDSFYIVIDNIFSAFGTKSAIGIKDGQVGAKEIEKTFDILQSIPQYGSALPKGKTTFEIAILLSKLIVLAQPEYKTLALSKSFELGYQNREFDIESYSDSLFMLLKEATVDSQRCYLWYALAQNYTGENPAKAYEYAGNAVREDSLSESGKNALLLRNILSEPDFSVNGNLVYSPQQSLLWSINAKNLKTLKYSIFSAPFENRADLMLGMYDLQEYTEKKEAIYSGVWNLDSLPQDYDSHSTEVYCKALEKGFYVLKVNDLFCVPFQVSGLSFTDLDKFGFVANRLSGAPEANIKAQIFSISYNYLTHLNDYKLDSEHFFDSNGFVSLPGKDSLPEDGYIYMIVGKTDTLILPNRKYPSYYRQQGKVRKDTTYRIHYLANLPIYRPGDSVIIKGVLCNSFYTVSAQHPISLSLRAPASNSALNKSPNTETFKLITDSMGGFTLSFKLPPDAKGGYWQLVSLGQYFGFNVDTYSPPLFEIKLTDNDSVVAGLAIGFTGVPLFKAAVLAEVSIAGLQQTWSKTLETNEDGRFTLPISEFSNLELLLPEKGNASKYYRGAYKVLCRVTDLNGETQESTIFIPLRRDKLYSELSAVSYDSDTFNIFTINSVGKEIKTNYRLQVYKLTDTLKDNSFDRMWNEPDFYAISVDTFTKLFPLEPYYTQEYRKKAAIKTLVEERSLSKNVFTLPLKEGAYFYKLYTFNTNNGEIDSTEGQFSRGLSPSIPTLYLQNSQDSFGFTFVNPLYKKGSQKAENEVYISYIVEERGGKVLNGVFKTSEKTTQRSIPISSFSVEKDLLCVWTYVCAQRLFSETSFRKGTAGDSTLEIVVDTIVSPLLSGQADTLRLKVLLKGKGVSVPLTLSLYDESLHSFSNTKWFYQEHPNLFPLPAITPFCANLNINISTWKNSVDYSTTGGKRHGLRALAAPMSLKTERGGNAKMSVENSLASSQQDVSSPAAEGLQAEDLQAEPFLESSFQARQKQASVFFYPTIKSNENGELLLPFENPANPGRYFLSLFGYDLDLNSIYKTLSFETVQPYMLFWQIPRFIYAGDSILFVCKASRLNPKDSSSCNITWHIGDSIYKSILKWDYNEREKTLAAPVYFKPTQIGNTNIRVDIVSEQGERDALGENIAVISDKITTKESVPFYLFAGEKINISLPKSSSAYSDTNVYFISSPEKTIQTICNNLYLDTSDNAYNALLHLLKNGLKGQNTAKDLDRLLDFITPENAFCWVKGQASDLAITLSIAQILSENSHPKTEQTIAFALKNKIIPYVDREVEKAYKKNRDSIPTLLQLRYLYTCALLDKRPSSLTIQSMQDSLLQSFASNCSLYPIREGVYGLYALYLRGEKMLFEQVWQYYLLQAILDKELGMYWKKENMGRSLGEQIRTASLLYRIFRQDGRVYEFSCLNRWIWSQNRTIDVLSASSLVQDIDVLRLGYNQLLYPLPLSKTLPLPNISIKGSNLSVDWSNAAGLIPDSLKNTYMGYGALTIRQEQNIRNVKESYSKTDLQVKTLLSNKATVGERTELRINITAKRNFSYVQIRVGRPSGSEYNLIRSGSKYSNGLAFYQSVQDKHIDLFIPYLQKGKYTLVYYLNAQNPGLFTTPPSTIESVFNDYDSFAGHSASGSMQIL